MDTKKRVGRAQRFDTIREERRRQKRRKRLAALLTISGVVILLIVVIAYTAVHTSSTKKPTASVATVKPITPNPRPAAVGNVMGDPNAPVKIVEYSDFQCPWCLKFYTDVEPSIVMDYISTGGVYFTYRSMGDWLGNESAAAAEAAYCAGDQGKFWEYHDILFANQTGENVGDFTSEHLITFAQNFGLDMDTFRSCLNNHKYIQQVTQDRADGIQAGVKGTPSFFINGKMFTGDPRSYPAFKTAIEAALAGK